MPLPLLVAHAQMLPKLTAAELHDAAVVALMPHIHDNDRRSQLRSWRDEAGGRFAVRRPQSASERDALMAASGIGVRRVKS